MYTDCSRHVVEEESIVLNLQPIEGRCVTFSDNQKGQKMGICEIGKHPLHIIENILVIEGLNGSC